MPRPSVAEPADTPAETGRVRPVLAALALVLALWVVIFVWQPVNFWLSMASAQVALMAVAFALRPDLPRMLRPRPGDVAAGIASAVALYGVFLVGDAVAARVLPFAEGQVGDVYTIRGQAAAAVIGVLLLFVIGPGEEIFWRGLVQRTFVERWGQAAGIVTAVAAYAGVHVVAANVMLVGAAAVGGLFWGLLYWWRRSLPAVIVSHAVWDLLVMVLFPIQ